MKNAIKYFLVFLLSFLSVFYNNNELNIILVVNILAFSMASGIKSFLFSLTGLLASGTIYYKINNEYITLMYSLISISIFFVLYHLFLIFNKKMIINYFSSTLLSITFTYLIHMISFKTYNHVLFIYTLVISICFCFLSSYLFKKFSYNMLLFEDNNSKIILALLVCIYLSNISLIINNKYIYYICLLALLITTSYFSIKSNFTNTMSLLSLLILSGYILKIDIISNNILLLLISSVLLSVNKSKYKLLNTLLNFSIFIMFYFVYEKYKLIEFLILGLIDSLFILLIKSNKDIDENSFYYNQYITNKNDMISSLNNISNMFDSISESFNNSYENEILFKAKNEVFDSLCDGCERLSKCYKKDKHLLINYLKDYLNNSLDDNKLMDIKNNCLKQESYFKLLDKFTTTYLINNYKNDDKNKLKQIVSANFNSFSNIINQCKNQISNDRLNKINYFYKNLKEELTSFNFDVLFVKNMSNDKSFIFDISIKNIRKKQIYETLIPILDKLLDTHMKVYKIDTSTLTFSYFIISIKEIDKLNISYAYKQSNEDILANGDSITSYNSDKQFYIALSDGMGNGLKANEESKFTLDILFSMIKTKMNVKSSITTCNDLIQIKNELESYTTLDLLAINKFSHIASFYKFGAINSFIIRDHIVNQINNYSLPLGIIDEIYISPSSYVLKRKDVIVLMSDGMIDDNNQKVLSILENVSYDDPKIICNVLFSQLLNIRKNLDDVSLIVITID